jgi:hypothetical protein
MSTTTVPAAGAAAPTHTTYPLRVTAHPEPGLSRWLWIVKPILVIPHVIVLLALWIAAFFVTLAAGFAILATGRYPRRMFDFSVGVIRWSWRVAYYTTSAFATDRYPPFSLARDPDYPTDIEVDYPQELSRGLVLVKWWLLVLPQYLVVAILSGGWGADHFGLIGLLALFAAIVLLVKGEYPRSFFDLIVGLNRWVLRVVAYAALLTDEYPPFRLDQGGTEPGSRQPQPPTPPVCTEG